MATSEYSWVQIAVLDQLFKNTPLMSVYYYYYNNFCSLYIVCCRHSIPMSRYAAWLGDSGHYFSQWYVSLFLKFSKKFFLIEIDGWNDQMLVGDIVNRVVMIFWLFVGIPSNGAQRQPFFKQPAMHSSISFSRSQQPHCNFFRNCTVWLALLVIAVLSWLWLDNDYTTWRRQVFQYILVYF